MLKDSWTVELGGLRVTDRKSAKGLITTGTPDCDFMTQMGKFTAL